MEQESAEAPAGMHASLRLRLERTLAEQAASREMSAETYACWSQMRSTHRVVVTKDTVLMAWRLFAGEPNVVNKLRVSGYAADLEKGSSATLVDIDGKPVKVDHTPRRVLPNIFMWLPRFSDIQYQPVKAGASILKFSLVFKMTVNPNSNAEGPLYLSEANAFHSMWQKGV